MKAALQPGLTLEFNCRVPENRTVPYLYPESPEFQLMPKVLATGYMVGLLEWACLLSIISHVGGLLVRPVEMGNDRQQAGPFQRPHQVAGCQDLWQQQEIRRFRVEGKKGPVLGHSII